MRAEQLRLRAEREKARQEAERIEKERKEAEAGKSWFMILIKLDQIS